MDFLANNWDGILSIINAIGLLIFGSRKRSGGVR